MKVTHVKNEPVWTHDARIATRAALKEDASADVCVVGAGIAGLTTAYLLAKAGRKVIVLDDGKIGGGQTSCTSAHLSFMLDRRYSSIVASRGVEVARLAAASHAAAIDLIETIALEEDIDCEFQRLDGYLFAIDDETTASVEQEGQILAGFGYSTELLAHVPWSSCLTFPALRVPRQARFQPLKYLRGLAKGLKHYGGVIHCQTHVTEVTGGKDANVKTRGGPQVSCGAIVVATNSPINDRYVIHTKQAPYMTYVVGARIPAGSVPDALYWDTDEPYHYIRLQQGKDDDRPLLLIGGEDHKTGQANDGDERFARLESWARERFAQIDEVEYHWAGQVFETLDGLAYIGANPGDAQNVFIVTGDSGMGLTHGTIAGRLLTDLIHGVDNPWSAVYDPARTPMTTVGTFVRENVNVAAQYAQWLLPGDVESVDEIKPGQGAIVREGLSKVAVYREPNGKLTRLTAVCPHLKGIVQWNSSESTWDCPCHGSRFDAHGKVLVGPANSNLERCDPRPTPK